MQIYISCFNKINTFNKNCIPISTASRRGWPYWLYKYYKKDYGSYFLNENNVMIGITEDKFSCEKMFSNLSEKCGEKPCPYYTKAPKCQFMIKYLEYLNKLDINYFLSEFSRLAEDVRKITNYIGDPDIVLMVYEQPSCKCAERPCLIEYFKHYNIDVKEWNADYGI